MSPDASDRARTPQNRSPAAPSEGGRLRAPEIRDEGFLNRLLRNLPGMAYRCGNDRDRTMEFVSEGCRTITGFAPQDLVENRVARYGRLIHPADRERVWAAVQRALIEGATFRVTYRIKRADGRERWVWEQGVGVSDDGGNPVAIEGFINDVTDSQELSEQVATTERRYRALVDQALAGVYVIRGGRFVYVNPRFAQIFGYTVEEILGMESFSDLVHPDDRDVVADKLRQRLSGALGVARYEFQGSRKDGSRCEVQVQGRRVDFDGAPAVMGVLLDVTEGRRAERRYHESQKMEALGSLARGVAHDFNNVLAVIKTTAHLLLDEHRADPRLAEDLTELVEAADRGAALSRQLMAFGREGAVEGSRVSLANTVEGLAPVLERLLPPGVALAVHIDADVPEVEVPPTRMEQVVMNLVLNARDAMPDGGEVRIAIRGDEMGSLDAETQGEAQVVMEVSDTGTGIPPEVRPRIFEPYFTTKGDRGTGLGLANVWRIVADAGGMVEVDSELGRGSTFTICLPVPGRAGEPPAPS